MNKKFSVLLGVAAMSTLGMSSAFAQSAEDRLSIDFSLNHDAFFGTNPFVGAAWDTQKGYDLTFYGIQWGTGTGSAWGQWTEFGLGVGFEMMDGALYVNPQLGFTQGSLLSSGAAEPGIIGDGIVPNLTMGLDTDEWEGEFYFGWYKDLRDKAPAGGSTNEYVHYWVNAGKKFSDVFSIGLHFEELYLSGGSNVSRMDGYRWVGPYFQVAKGNAGMRFSFGTDTTSDSSSFSASDFYKLQVFFSF